jgi:hypothetical protein
MANILIEQSRARLRSSRQTLADAKKGIKASEQAIQKTLDLYKIVFNDLPQAQNFLLRHGFEFQGAPNRWRKMHNAIPLYSQLQLGSKGVFLVITCGLRLTKQPQLPQINPSRRLSKS